MIFVLLFFLIFDCSFATAQSQSLKIDAGCDYRWGSHDYHSNFLYGMTTYNSGDKTSFRGTLSFFNDTYYDLIVPLTLRGKYKVICGLWLGGILSVAAGGLAKSNDTYTSDTFGGFLEKKIIDALITKFEYKHVNGYIHTSGCLNKDNNRGRKAGSLFVYEVTSSISSSDVFNGKMDVDLDEYVGGLSSTIEYTHENQTGDITLDSYGFELFYLVGKKLYLTNGIVLTRESGIGGEKYFIVGISRTF